jgi:glycerophosphoryl diester phosphodiesterase
MSDRLSVVGHRGLIGYPGVIENTMSAFDICFQAIDASGRTSGGIELDLQETADGEIVIFHDDTLGSVERICDYEYEELLSVCEYVPKFKDFVCWLYNLQRDGRLNNIRLDIIIDMKPHNKSSLLLTVNQYLSNWAFDHSHIKFYLGIWTSDWLRIVQRYGWSHGSLMLIAEDTSCFQHLNSFHSLSIDIRLVKRNPIIALKLWWWRKIRPNRCLAFWTINAPRDMTMCKFLGADAVIVDDVTKTFKNLKN